MPDRVSAKPIDDMSCQDLRTEIGFQVGFKADRILRKPHLNSTYGYLNGEFLCEPGKIYSREAPSLRQFRTLLAHDVGFQYEPGDREEYPSGLQYSRSGLVSILEAVRAVDDDRALAYEPLMVDQ